MKMFFRPAELFMGRLNFVSKLLVMLIIVGIPLSLLSFLNLSHMNQNVQMVREEKIGISYSKELVSLLKDIQLYRGMSNALYSGDTRFTERVATTRSVIKNMLDAVDFSTGGSASWRNTQAKWKAMKEQLILLLEPSSELSPPEQFDALSNFNNEILLLLREIRFLTRTSLYPSLAHSYLGDELSINLPFLTEKLGVLRGKGVGFIADGVVDKGESTIIIGLLSTIQTRINISLVSFDNITLQLVGNQSDLMKRFRISFSKIQLFHDMIAERLRDELLGSMDAKDYFSSATGAISVVYRLSDFSQILLNDYLSDQIKLQNRTLMFHAFITLLSIMLAIYLFVGLYFNTKHTIDSFSDASKSVSEGDYSSRLHIKSHDELAQIGHSFNTMAEQVEKDIFEIERSKAALHDLNRNLQDEIEKRKEIYNKLQERGAEINAIIDTADAAIITIDDRGVILNINKATEKIFGYTPEETIGKTIDIFMTDDHTCKHKTYIDAYMKTGKAKIIGVGKEMEARRKDGSLFPIDLDISEIPLTDSRMFAGFIRDISERKLAEEEIHKAKLAAESANRAKSSFLANMSHEIRTPMNAVIGFTDMLTDTDLTQEQAEYAASIQKGGEALLSLINDVLDFSKIEAGELDFESIDFDPELSAYDACELTRPRIGTKPIEIICNIDERVPPQVVGDPTRFRQVLINLLGNASKFTEKGEIALTLYVEEKSADSRLKLHAEVRDTGIGIPSDKVSQIFTPFQQVDGSVTRKYGGTGLGLSICKQIAELIGGDIWAESVEGTGSTFHFTGWFGTSDRAAAVAVHPVSLSGKRVLAIDDNGNNLTIVSHILESAGMIVVSETEGSAGIDSFTRSLEGGEPFDICISDIQMPGMNGYDVARAIRTAEDERNIPVGTRVPLIALSSLMERDIRKSEEAGFSGFLSKPIRRKLLIQMLETLLGEKNSKPAKEDGKKKIATQYSIREELKRSVNILFVEDNPDNQLLGQRLLTKAGYTVHLADNGRVALDTYTAGHDEFDLILMDVQMPEMDGLEATKQIRLWEKEQVEKIRVPIIAMTAHAMTGDREMCIDAGMDDYTSKPIKRQLVYELIEKWVLV